MAGLVSDGSPRVTKGAGTGTNGPEMKQEGDKFGTRQVTVKYPSFLSLSPPYQQDLLLTHRSLLLSTLQSFRTPRRPPCLASLTISACSLSAALPRFELFTLQWRYKLT